MNFFEAQDRARRTTRWLVIVYAIATLLIVAGVTLVVGVALYAVGAPGRIPEPGILIGVACLAALLIVGSTLYRTAALSAGGSRVAADMGGTLVPADVQDPLRRRLRNVVEEMSIASGVPVPDIFVLEAEDGINAFAAGYTPDDAAIAVTRGALDLLDRDELQGVIAHEFSHILNGDMRINIRMIGVLFGIMVLSVIGRIILRGGYHGGIASRRNRGAPAVMAVGVGLAILGWIGVFFARLIKAAVSRQRETLADAAAVQFTRQTEGLANALKKIGGYAGKSYLRAADPEEISHMLFARGSRRLASLFATHPPLSQRIKALDPAFREGDFPQVRLQPRPMRDDAAGLADTPRQATAATADGVLIPPGSSISATTGNPAPPHIAYARELRASIPESLYAAAHSEEASLLLAVALVLDRSGRHLERQLQLVSDQLGRERTLRVRRYYDALQEAGDRYSLPLLEIASPALKRRPLPQLEFIAGLARRLVETDGEVDLYEYCFYRVLSGNLRQDAGPAARRRATFQALRRAALRLIAILADGGNEQVEQKTRAFRAGAGKIGSTPALPEAKAAGEWTFKWTIADLDRCIGLLRDASLSFRESLIDALSMTIGHDNRMTVREAELLRAICAGLDCPLPPLIITNPLAPTELRAGSAGEQAREQVSH